MDTLHRLMYVSTPQPGVDETQLRDILRVARLRNPPAGLTGFLAFSPDHFVQVIEGGRRALTECLLRIARDARHSGLVLLSFEAIARREFNDWSMGYMAIGSRHQALLMRYSCDGTLQPMALHAPSLLQLLRELADQSTDPHGRPMASAAPQVAFPALN